MSRQDASSNYYGYPLLIRAVWLYRPNLSPVIPVILHWDGLRFRSSRILKLYTLGKVLPMVRKVKLIAQGSARRVFSLGW